ncbi:MAG: class I SAM-dependent methyltransferase [Candidatus Omnitrophica bacterium]|nr:class I SAM-dependent methyltransferase [Candidatus Omnitrophota bacterium]
MNIKSYQLKKNPRYGFYQINPTPTAEEIAKFYTDEFYSGDYKRFNDSSLDIQLRDRDFYQGHYSDMTQAFSDILGESLKSKSILDIGCGWGQALLFFRETGLSCYGFDPAPEAIEYGRKQGLNVVTAGMEEMAVFGDKRFDIVTLLNVLEHFADPVTVLEEIYKKVLKPGGVLAIDVPNEFNVFQICAKELHHLGEWWVAPPGHLNYFSADSLKKLLEGTGFSVRLVESSFPMELFLLFGDNYVGDGNLGRQCHERRMAFENNMRKLGRQRELRRFYQSLAEQNLGRQVIAYAVRT